MEEDYKLISGEPYEGELTGRPERPYVHDYTKTLVMKIFVSEPSETEGETRVSMNFDEILYLIKQVDKITLQIPKILYLVGWQYHGHDDKYPAFFEVNEALKRECDFDARDSLLWLMKKAYDYHTTVSLHINLTDAYQDSPLWETYLRHNLISRRDNGELMKIGEWGYYRKKSAYQVNYTREWESGFTKQRIDKLLDLLPIKKAGTIHCDAFFARASKDTSLESEKAAKRKICRYFRNQGIDVTTEFLHGTKEGFSEETYTDGNESGVLGIIPFIWHLNQSQQDYMKRPASLVTGAGINPDLEYGNDEAIGFLFGKTMYGEDVFFDKENRYGLNPDWEREFKKKFCMQTVVWTYLNQYQRVSLYGEGQERILQYEDDLIADWENKVIRHKEVLLREKDNVFVPMVWSQKIGIIAYSMSGYQAKEWMLPKAWEQVTQVIITEVSSESVVSTKRMLLNRKITLSLEPEQMVVIYPFLGGK